MTKSIVGVVDIGISSVQQVFASCKTKAANVG